MTRRLRVKKKLRLKNIALALVFPSVLLIIYLISPRVLLAKRIECYTQFGLCPDEWAANLETLKNTALLRPLPKFQAANLLHSVPQIDSLSLYRRLPDTLVVSVRLRTPLGVVGDESRLLGVADEKGIIFSLSPPPTLPKLITQDEIKLNHQLSPNQVLALKALNRIRFISPSEVSGILQDTTLTAQLNPATAVIIDVKSDPDSWVGTLQLILDRSKISPKSRVKIDLRFTNPVISYN